MLECEKLYPHCAVLVDTVDMKLNGLNVVISMEYMMTLKDFFLDSLPPKSPATSVPAPRPGGYLTSCTAD